MIGTLVVLVGLGIRTASMYIAGSNFHHLVREEREQGHQLVTHGIYAFLRHPAYFGWFWYSVSTQLLLTNPLCICLFAFASWRFFSERIPEEEKNLIKFFGKAYEDYRERVHVWIPFINNKTIKLD
eukprot:TRINITY_DN2096_c0_g1_i1.p1 TRINITY_DN2096_c0_g1~~TRINITY_DN2096_c0_g1_i1.p1  ORF type:complete len:126 (-),score=16.98 TRINITY_DN2096_c0_g1_i1:5-382(-)